MAAGEEPRAPSKSRLAALLTVVFAAGLLLAPIWLVAYPPLLDYPNHLARAFVLVHLQDPAFHFARYYRADWGLYPYLGMDLSMLALQRWLAVELAGRVFLSICALAFPLGAGAGHAEAVAHLSPLGWHDLCRIYELPDGRPVRRRPRFRGAVESARIGGRMHRRTVHAHPPIRQRVLGRRRPPIAYRLSLP